MTDLTVIRLSPSLVRPSYALIRLAEPSLTLQQWHDHTRRYLSSEARSPDGILVAIDRNGHILALLEFARCAGRGDTLQVRRLIAPGIVRRQTSWLRDRLLAAAGDLGPVIH